MNIKRRLPTPIAKSNNYLSSKGSSARFRNKPSKGNNDIN